MGHWTVIEALRSMRSRVHRELTVGLSISLSDERRTGMIARQMLHIATSLANSSLHTHTSPALDNIQFRRRNIQRIHIRR